jgi:hypothetical protein
MKTRPAHWPTSEQLKAQRVTEGPYPKEIAQIFFEKLPDGTYQETLRVWNWTRRRTHEEEGKPPPFEILREEKGRRFREAPNTENPEAVTLLDPNDFSFVKMEPIEEPDDQVS